MSDIDAVWRQDNSTDTAGSVAGVGILFLRAGQVAQLLYLPDEAVLERLHGQAADDWSLVVLDAPRSPEFAGGGSPWPGSGAAL